MAAAHEPDRERPLAVDQRVERRERPQGMEDRLLLVQVELREPPERIPAQREAAAEGRAVDLQTPEALDPRTGLFVGALFVGRLQVIEQIDPPRSGARVDVERDHRTSGPRTSSIAASTRATTMPDRQSGVWPTQRAGGRRIRLHGLHGRSMRTI